MLYLRIHMHWPIPSTSRLQSMISSLGKCILLPLALLQVLLKHVLLLLAAALLCSVDLSGCLELCIQWILAECLILLMMQNLFFTKAFVVQSPPRAFAFGVLKKPCQKILLSWRDRSYWTSTVACLPIIHMCNCSKKTIHCLRPPVQLQERENGKRSFFNGSSG